MAAISIIRLSSIEYSRIDSEFYQPTYISDGEKFKKTKFKFNKLSKFISKPVRTGSTPKNRLILKDEEIVSFIKTNTLREGKIVYDSVEYLPKRSIRNSDYIKDNSILVTIIGATKDIVGRVAIKEKKDPISTTNQNVGIIEFKDSINPYFGMIYLQSDYGRHQLWRHSRQTEQVNLNCREIERVLFPEVSVNIQSVIGDLVKNSFELQFKSNQIYKQAEELLNKELGLDSLVFDKPKSYVANFSEVVENLRFDSEHFLPEYESYSELVKNYKNGYEKLLTNINYIKPSLNLNTIDSKYIKYLELSNINPSIGNVNEVQEILKSNAPSRAKRLLKEGDVIASSVVGSVEKAGLVSSKEDGYIASNGFFQFRSDYYPSEFILLLIKSDIIKKQFFKNATGGILSAMADSYLSKIIIPKIPFELVNEIASLVRESHKYALESIQLLEEAKKQVEDLIENQANQN